MATFPQITVFTPTYNRKNKLMRAYESLKAQSSSNFIWQIIDDGSTDGTDNIVEKWIKEDQVPIEYFKVKNNGKAAAYNTSLDYCYTPYWICLDSDDTFVHDGIEKLTNKIPFLDEDSELYGLIGLRYNFEGQPMQKQNIPEELHKTTQLELRFKFSIPPEYYQLYKVEVIKKYKYPIIYGEKYFPLSYIPNIIDQKYKMITSNDEIMRIEYQDDGITKNKNRLIWNNPVGYTMFKHQMSILVPNFKYRLISFISYNSVSIISRKRFDYDKKTDRLMAVLTFPLGAIDYFLRFKLNMNFKIEKVNS